MWIPNVYESIFGIIVDGSDFEGGGSLGSGTGDSGCRATMSHPYKCCGAGVGPWECCRGLIGCLQLIAESLFPVRTTMANFLNKWTCAPFNSFFGRWINTIRTLFTWGAIFFTSNAGVPKSRTVVSFLSFVIYPDFKPPTNSLGCMIFGTYYIIIGLGIFALLFLALQLLSLQTAAYALSAQTTSMAIRRDILKLQDEMAKMKKAKKTLPFASTATKLMKEYEIKK